MQRGIEMTFNDYCKHKKCPQFLDWVFVDANEQEWACISCQLQGQSYDIAEIAEDCPFKNELQPLCDTCAGLACGDECDGRSHYTKVPKW